MELFVYKSYLSQDTEKQNLIQQWVCKGFYPVTVCSALDWRQPYYWFSNIFKINILAHELI